MNEWEFTAEVASWINILLSKDHSLPFSSAKCEQRSRGSQKRRDLTLLDKSNRVCLTGEIKLPYRKDGGSPFVQSVIDDARKKAARAKSEFFFTWNVNECALWETTPAKDSLRERDYRSWRVTSVHAESHMDMPMTITAIKDWLPLFLNDFAAILRGTAPLGKKSPDEKFIEALESALQMPIALTNWELSERYKKARFKSELDKWMRDDQGWVILSDKEGERDNLERAAKFACYALVNKLVFHEALLKRYGTRMDGLSVPEHIDTGDALRTHLEGSFARAKNTTGDYETVFGEEHHGIGNRIPFYADGAAPHWRVLISQIHEFDFSKLDYEVIGNIFERLIGPEERHKYGQFYTRVEIVDLINSFCIRRGDEKVMDPACGGGTFLVRAYARKRELAPARKHGQLLSDLYGVDYSSFAAHLTTINLATRDLVEAENYPQVVRKDFFDVVSDRPFVALPKRNTSNGLGNLQHREVTIAPLDAVVGNPPYIRQEGIPKAKRRGKGGPEPGTKEYYQKLVADEQGAILPGRSDIHCYFWPHAASFLKPDAYLCLLTSSQWLDVEYGFRLQEYILRNFDILAVLESIDEPWFVGARVATTVTILRRQLDEKKRMDNTVRFVQLRRPVAQIIAHDGTTAGAILAADAFRDEILSLKENTSNERYRARLVRQGALWDDGVKLGVIMGKSKDPGDEDSHSQTGEYYGGKWGVHLRAPDLWFQLLDDYGKRFAPLGELADVRFGVKSGKDCFFYPIDGSADCLANHTDPETFLITYGVPRCDVASGQLKLVKCGEGRGEIRPIEAQYLEPEVHSLMEVDRFSVEPEDCSRLILLAGEPREKLEGTHVLDYIKWGESRNFHTGATCASRVTQEREWYDLTGHQRGALFWPKSQQYKHAVPTNDANLQCNCNLYDVNLSAETPSRVMAGILNSSVTILSKFQFGRPVGVEGNFKTEVVDVNAMLVPDPRLGTSRQSEEIARTFSRLMRRRPVQFLSERRMREMAYRQAGKEEQLKDLSDECELDMDDRRALDDAVLQMLGVRSKRQRRELIDRLYAYLRDFFEWTRQKEEKAIANKKKAKRKGAARPEELASQVFQEMLEKEPGLFRHYDPDFIDAAKPYDTYELPQEGAPEPLHDLHIPHGVRFSNGKKRSVAILEVRSDAQVNLVVLVASTCRRGFVRIPYDDDECARVHTEYERFALHRERQVRAFIESRTADEEMQEKIYAVLMPMLLRGAD